jgi:PAS domain S-box-containing protein
MRRFERIAGGSIVAATVAIVLGSLALVAWTQSGLRDEFISIRRSHEVIDALNRLEGALRDAEDGMRDYALGGDQRDLDRYAAKLPALGETLAAVRDLIMGNPEQLDRLRGLSAQLGQETDRLARVAGYLQAGSHDRAVALLLAGPDRRPLFADISAALQAMRAAELDDLQHRRDRANGTSTWLIQGTALGGIGLLAVLALGWALVYWQQRQRRATETDLRDSEKLIGSIFDHAQIGIALAGADGVLKRTNATFATLIGRPGDRLIGRPVDRLAAESGSGIEAYLGRGPVPDAAGEVAVQLPDGTRRTLIAVATALAGQDGGITRFATFADITPLKQAQADLEASSHRIEQQRLLLDAVLNSSIDGIFAFAAERDGTGRPLNFRCVMGNQAAARLRRRPLSALIGDTLDHILVDTEHYRLKDEFERVIRTGAPFEAERQVDEPDLGPRWYRLVAVPMGDGVMITIGDITDRKRLEGELRAAANRLVEREGRLAAIYDSVLDGIITINPSGSIESFNRAAARIFGYKPDEVMRRNIRMLMPEPYASAHDGYIERYVASGKSRVIGTVREIEGRRADGSIFPMEIALTETLLGQGRLFVAAVRDVTDRRALERVKNEFVSTVSHELRTPLTSIAGALSLLAGGAAGNLPAKALSLVTIARSNCDRLTRLINDILDLERIEAGKMVFEFGAVALPALLERALDDNLEFARKFGVRLELAEIPPEAMLWADPHRLMQVLTNLISNAVKFSPADGVVTVSATVADAMVRIAVEDRGRGIPEAFRDRIFQKFAQADTADNRQKGGTGLGLSIVKSIVERHGGSVSFQSDYGQGSVFTVELPRRRPRLEDEAGDAVLAPRVLICEDDPDVARILAWQLQQAGYGADRAATADAAIGLLAEQRYDAMTLDLRLPDADGLSLLRRVREDARHAGMPVIIVSAWLDSPAGQAATLEGEVLGVVDWLGKPVDQGRLLHALEMIPKRAGRPRVLHVEDDPDIVRLVNFAVRDLADITAVSTVAEARKVLAQGTVDLMILDVGLIDGSGLALLDGDGPKPPTVLFSAQEVNPDRRDELVAVLVKSQTTLDQLSELIRQQLAAGVEA